MASIRSGSKQALIVVDVQVGVAKGAWQGEAVIARVARAVARARAAGVPVIWVQHQDEELLAGSDEWCWVPELVPAEGELLIHKHFNSGFEDTGLEAALAAQGVSHIVLAGMATNWCIRATAYGALDRGYDLTLLSDAHTTRSYEMEGMKFDAAMLVADLNVVFTWLSYPGRKSGTAKTEEFAFA
jgi:nicotinamidase-related amidase